MDDLKDEEVHAERGPMGYDMMMREEGKGQAMCTFIPRLVIHWAGRVDKVVPWCISPSFYSVQTWEIGI